jgi:glycosyltransferase involved in cell wall biosynthesis
LTIAGDGPARKELEKISRDLVVEDKVQFLGMVKREKLAGIYREHDMFVTASAMETQGLVVLEAMASGLPVVAVNKYALPDLVKNWRNGFLVGVGDDREMAGKIMKLISDGTMAEKMGREARKMTAEHDLDMTIKKLEEIYKRLPVCKDGGWWQRMKSRLGLNGWV